jgi:quinol monooxygenase YgiN
MQNTVTQQAIRKMVRITGKTGRSVELHYALKALETETRKEPGCREFCFFKALSSDDSFLLLEDFVDQNAFDHHMQLPHTKAFFQLGLTTSVTATDLPESA